MILLHSQVISFYMLILFTCCPLYAVNLTLKQAEDAALFQSPEVKSLGAKAQALGQSAIAAGQLSDPKLLFGALNVPVNDFSFSQTMMTQTIVGLQQAFPRGRSLHYRFLHKKELSASEAFKLKAMQLQILQAVRLSWLNLYYWLQAKQIILNQKKVFQHLVGVSESMLANNKAQQKDVIRAQLEVTEMDNRLLMVRQQIETARAELGRWVGPKLANQAHPNQLAIQPTVPKTNELLSIIEQHPVLKSDAALIHASHANVDWAKQQYKPGFNVGLVYGYRQARNPDGSKLPDMLTAQAGMDLPIFPKNRQDRTLNASIDNLSAAHEDQISHYRQLREALMIQLASFKQQKSSAQLYHQQLIPEAKQYAEATMIAYQNTQTDFPTLARAYVRELNTELSGLRAVVNQEIARVNLLYLQGK